MLDFQKKILGPAGHQVFIFCRQNKYSGRQKLYLRINWFSFAKDNRLSLVYVYAKKKVYLGGQVGDQAWKFSRHWVKAGRIGDPTGRKVEPCIPCAPLNNERLEKILKEIIPHFCIIYISKIQLVVYYQCCILFGWATTRLYVIAP